MQKLPAVKVQQILRPGMGLVTMKEDTTVIEAARIMAERNIGSTLVLDASGQFLGIVTERDILHVVAACITGQSDLRLRDIATTEVLHCTPDTPVTVVEELMHWHRIRHIPVFENGKPVAVLSSRDIMAYQIMRSKDMKIAAEQIARMSIELKSPDLNELVNWIVTEVARVFFARRTVLWLEPDENDPDFGGFVARSGCWCSHDDAIEQIQQSATMQGPAFLSTNHNGCSSEGSPLQTLLVPLELAGCGQSAVYGVRKRRGFLCVCGIARDGGEIDEVIFYKAALLSEILSVSLTNARLYREYHLARSESRTDTLTGLGTRRVLEGELDEEYARAKRYSHSFCLAIMDIDKFKLINDGQGHAVGDKALQRLSATIQASKRESDIAVRYGGDEMVILMPETELEQAITMLERLRSTIEQESAHSQPAITISCGLAQWSPGRDESPRDIFLRADNALYDAKRSGRNQVCVSDNSLAASMVPAGI